MRVSPVAIAAHNTRVGRNQPVLYRSSHPDAPGLHVRAGQVGVCQRAPGGFVAQNPYKGLPRPATSAPGWWILTRRRPRRSRRPSGTSATDTCSTTSCRTHCATPWLPSSPTLSSDRDPAPQPLNLAISPTTSGAAASAVLGLFTVQRRVALWHRPRSWRWRNMFSDAAGIVPIAQGQRATRNLDLLQPTGPPTRLAPSARA